MEIPMATRLIKLAEGLWTIDTQPAKAVTLAKLASTLPTLKDQAAFPPAFSFDAFKALCYCPKPKQCPTA